MKLTSDAAKIDLHSCKTLIPIPLVRQLPIRSSSAFTIDNFFLWRYIYDKIQYSVVEIKSSKSGMHQSEVAWQQADSANTHNQKGKTPEGKTLKGTMQTGITQRGKTQTGIT